MRWRIWQRVTGNWVTVGRRLRESALHAAVEYVHSGQMSEYQSGTMERVAGIRTTLKQVSCTADTKTGSPVGARQRTLAGAVARGAGWRWLSGGPWPGCRVGGGSDAARIRACGYSPGGKAASGGLMVMVMVQPGCSFCSWRSRYFCCSSGEFRRV